MADAGYFRVGSISLLPLSDGYVSVLKFVHFLHHNSSQGTSADQDNRFSDKEKKLLNSMRFEESLAKKVDMKKVIFFFISVLLHENVFTTSFHELHFWR